MFSASIFGSSPSLPGTPFLSISLCFKVPFKPKVTSSKKPGWEV